jgi:SpoIID/LytB domain protein
MRSSIEARLLQRSLALALAGLLAGFCSLVSAAQSGSNISKDASNSKSSRGPILRVALMGDVSSVALSCKSGLDISPASAIEAGLKKTSPMRIRIEVRDETKKGPERQRTMEGLATRRLVALDSERLIASSEDRLVVSSASEAQVAEPKKAGVDGAQDHGYDFARPRQFDEERPKNSSRQSTDPEAVAVRVGGKLYRGEIQLVLNKRGLINVINAVAIEDYLLGVVPLELSPLGFPEIEALKAQAVAARSYALFHRGEHEDEGYDIRDDARSQVYGGVAAEHELSDRAIEETRGVAATSPGDDGRWVPIDALYSANCGGHTENNEDVFGGRARSYLRGVACEVDRTLASDREIATSRKPASYFDQDGRSMTREISLLDVLGFAMPRQITSRYLASAASEEELKGWSERAAGLSLQPPPAFKSSASLSSFAELAVASVYGLGRASVSITPGDASYVLSGFDIRDGGNASSQSRASLALLVRTGALRLPLGGAVDLSAAVSRATALATFARALLNRMREASAAPSSPKNETSRPASLALQYDVAARVEAGRLVVESPSSQTEFGSAGSNGSHGYVRVEASAARVGAKQESPAPNQRKETRSSLPSGANQQPLSLPSPPTLTRALDFAQDAWLFRNLAGESYQVNRLALIGGEQLVYHVGQNGRVDFAEVFPSERSAAVDRFSRVASWRERVTPDELAARLARRRTDVGKPQAITPVEVSPTGRVNEIEILGTSGRSRLRGAQIKSVLGLRENLFVVDRETDAGGRVVAFVFTGRGWGHGVGMCQTGAYGLAKEGYSYKSILQTYYTGIRVQKIY